MTIINQDNVIRSVADVLQTSASTIPSTTSPTSPAPTTSSSPPAARDAIPRIFIYSRMCAEGYRRICQDTGMVTAFVKVGMQTQSVPSAKFGMMTFPHLCPPQRL